MRPTLFDSLDLGPVQLRNRTIRAAAFEGMAKKHDITQELIDYHESVAKGGVGMSTVAYASINKQGLAFNHQLLMEESYRGSYQKLTDAIHKEGAKASIQLGHCGLMGNRKIAGRRPMAPSSKFNWYGPTHPKKMSQEEIKKTVEDFGRAAHLVAECGFDAVEIHAGHGYLISQFLSPYTNKRKDKYGGSLENRMRFMKEVLVEVRKSLPDDRALLVKMNSWDGFKGGISKEEGIEIAKQIERAGANAIIVSGGFVSKAPMYVMRGKMPVTVMAHFIKDPIKRFFVKIVGSKLIKPFPYQEGFFLDDAGKIKNEVSIPVIAIGGMNSLEVIQNALDQGFEGIAMARALIENPNFINDLKQGNKTHSDCTLCNYCVAKIYDDTMTCHLNENIDNPKLKKAIEKI